MTSAANITNLLIFQNLRIPEYQQKITECAGDIMERYSEVQSSIVYENVGKLADNIMGNEMANTTRIINIKKYSRYARNELEPYFMLTFIIENINELEKYFISVYRILGWNSRAKHFIIYIGDEDINTIFRLSWERFIVKLIVMDKNQDLYTYDPLGDNMCGQNITKRFLFHCENKSFTDMDEIYAGEGFEDFKGCEVRVLTFPLVPYVINVEDPDKPGFEIVALKELSKLLNFTLKFVPNEFTYWGHKTEENTYTEMYGMFFSRRADLMLGMLVANGSFLYDFDASVAHTKSDLAFYVPPAAKTHSWENVTKIYTKITWGIIGISMVLMAIVWNVVARLQRTQEKFDKFVICAYYVFGISFGESMKQPSTHTFRYIFVLWALYSLILSSTFESSLMSFLTKPTYEQEIETITQLTQANLQYGGFGYAKELFGVENKNENYMKIYNNWEDCELNEACVNRTAQKQDFAALSDVRQVNYLTPGYYINKQDGTQKLHQMPVTSSFYMWILMLKGFPLKNSIDKVIQRFIEFGFMEKWIEDVSSTIDQPATINQVALNFEHIVFPLIVLAIGHSLALLVFICEVLGTKIGRRRKSKTN